MLEDELHQSAAGDTPPEPEAKESDAAVPAEETGSIPEKTTAAEPAEGDVPPEPPKWKKVLQTAKKVVLKLPYACQGTGTQIASHDDRIYHAVQLLQNVAKYHGAAEA